MVKVQYVSDLHLEFTPENINCIKHSAPILCLCGDISVCGNAEDFALFKKFIAALSEMKFKHILHVAGNHEYYCSARPGIRMKTEYNFQKINDTLTKLSSEFPKYRFLNNTCFDYNTGSRIIRFIGTTLWSRIPDALQVAAKKFMYDYEQIVYGAGTFRKILPSDISDMNKAARLFISKSITAMKKIEKEKKITGILLTHHAPFWPDSMRDPSAKTKSMYDINFTKTTEPGNYCYYNDMLEISAPIKYVIYGHTHIKDNRTVNGIKYLSNPRGRPGQQLNYSDSETIDL